MVEKIFCIYILELYDILYYIFSWGKGEWFFRGCIFSNFNIQNIVINVEVSENLRVYWNIVVFLGVIEVCGINYF